LEDKNPFFNNKNEAAFISGASFFIWVLKQFPHHIYLKKQEAIAFVSTNSKAVM
jgi:hypothetical protein